MKYYLVLMLAVVPAFAKNDLIDELIGEEIGELAVESAVREYIRDTRQAQNYRSLNQAPGYIQQLVRAQDSRPPLVAVRPQHLAKLNIPPPAQPQVVPQSQISQYRPQVTYSSASQQPANPQYSRPIPQAPQQLQPQQLQQLQPQQLQHLQPQQLQQLQPQQLQPQLQQQLQQLQRQSQLQRQPQLRPGVSQQALIQPNVNLPVRQLGSNLPPHLQQLRLLQNNLANPGIGRP